MADELIGGLPPLALPLQAGDTVAITRGVAGKGRKTTLEAVTDAVLQIAGNRVLDFIFGAQRGDLLVRNAGGWTRLAAGEAGQVLTTAGPGDDASWQDAPGVLTINETAPDEDGNASLNGGQLGTFGVQAAASLDLATAPETVAISGDDPITSLGGALPAGTRRTLLLLGTPTLVHGPAMQLSTGADIEGEPGDQCGILSTGGGNYVMQWYQRFSGAALVGGGDGVESVNGIEPVDGDVILNGGAIGTVGTVASAATLDLTASAEHVFVTGTTGISSLGSGIHGMWRVLRFEDELLLSHSASLSLITGADITTHAGDQAKFRYYESGPGWGMEWYQRFSGRTLEATFIALDDVPDSYEDQAGKAVRVNGAETGLEFYDPAALETDTIFHTPTRGVSFSFVEALGRWRRLEPSILMANGDRSGGWYYSIYDPALYSSYFGDYLALTLALDGEPSRMPNLRGIYRTRLYIKIAFGTIIPPTGWTLYLLHGQKQQPEGMSDEDFHRNYSFAAFPDYEVVSTDSNTILLECTFTALVPSDGANSHPRYTIEVLRQQFQDQNPPP